MKLKELSVGDLVMINGEIHHITAIYGEKGAVSLNGREFITYVNDLQPIPITEDFLNERFFLSKNQHGYEVCDCWKIWSNPNYGYILATLVIDEFGGGSYEPCLPCTFVHELQHFLRLKHIEKEIEL